MYPISHPCPWIPHSESPNWILDSLRLPDFRLTPRPLIPRASPRQQTLCSAALQLERLRFRSPRSPRPQRSLSQLLPLVLSPQLSPKKLFDLLRAARLPVYREQLSFWLQSRRRSVRPPDLKRSIRSYLSRAEPLLQELRLSMFPQASSLPDLRPEVRPVPLPRPLHWRQSPPPLAGSLPPLQWLKLL